MKLYWIGYDLDKPGQDYKDLISALTKMNAKRILKSDWFLESELTSDQLRTHLVQFIDRNDRMLVSEVYYNAAWQNLLLADQAALDMYNRSAKRC